MELTNERLDGINPFDPDDEATQKKAVRVSELLKPLEDPATLYAEITAHREAISRLSIGDEYRWVGWLMHEPSGWVCVSDTPPAADMNGRLSIYTKAGTETPRFYPIGTMNRGNPAITNASAFLAEGHPIYLYKE